MFSNHPKTNFIFSTSFNFLSANAFSLDQSKILSFGKVKSHFARAQHHQFFNTVGKDTYIYQSSLKQPYMDTRHLECTSSQTCPSLKTGQALDWNTQGPQQQTSSLLVSTGLLGNHNLPQCYGLTAWQINSREYLTTPYNMAQRIYLSPRPY